MGHESAARWISPKAPLKAQVADLDARLAQDPEAGREQLRRWLKDGSVRIGPNKDGAIVAKGEILPLVVISDDGAEKGTTRNRFASL